MLSLSFVEGSLGRNRARASLAGPLAIGLEELDAPFSAHLDFDAAASALTVHFAIRIIETPVYFFPLVVVVFVLRGLGGCHRRS